MKTVLPSPRPSSWVEIDLTALRDNYRALRKTLPPRTGIMAVVKADAYGHGLVPVSKTLADLQVSALAVGSVEEGVSLRRSLSGRIPIVLLLGLSSEEAPLCLRYRLTPVVYSLETAEALNRAAAGDRTTLPIHLKVDTGMGRLGIPWSDLNAFLEKILKLNHLRLTGLTSHFGQADDRNRDYNRLQWNRFLQAMELVRSKGWSLTQNHMANSAAFLNFPHSRLDFVRPGILLYGCNPLSHPSAGKALKVRPVMSLKSRILQVKDVPKGVHISYGGTYKTRSRETVAVIASGYANGYPRSLSNHGEVLIRRRRYPIVGRVCMNLTVVRLEASLGIQAGEEVILMGGKGKQMVTPDELAWKAGTIAYELLCLMGRTNQRVYLP